MIETSGTWIETSKAWDMSKLTWAQAKGMKDEQTWVDMEKITLEQAAVKWLASLTHLTAKNYRSGLEQLAKLGILDTRQSLRAFALMNHSIALERMRGQRQWTPATAQARAALYISFTKFLNRATQGLVPCALPIKSGAGRTFYKVRTKVKSEALSREQWTKLLETMREINIRDSVIASVILQGARRAQEVLNTRVGDFDGKKGLLRVIPSKGKGTHQEIWVTLPAQLSQEVEKLIDGRNEGFLFRTGSGKAVAYRSLYGSIVKAGRRIGLKVHPHCLRASAITAYRQMGLQDFQIQKLTGHASAAMVHAYDKSSNEENASRFASLV